MSFQGLTWPDYLVIMVYFVFIIMVGLVSSWKTKNNDSVEGYFLSSRNMRFVPVGASIFASNIGASHFIGLAGSGAASGIGVSMFDLTATYPALMLGWLFVPVYMASGVVTMPEYLRKRFGGQRIRAYMSFLSLLLYIFTKISADLFAGALFITHSTRLMGDSDGAGAIYASSLFLLAVSGLFAAFGGLTAVMWTDLVSTVLMILGACVLSGISFSETDGYTRMIERYFVAVADNDSRALVDPDDPDSGYCGEVPPDAMHLFKDQDSDLPWTAATFGMAISSIWYWCTDQVIVQRSLASKNMTHAKGGTILTGYLKLLPLWIMIFPGMAARVLFPNEVACADPDICYDICSAESGCTNLAFVMLVTEKMPEGVRGLMLAVLLAALMSSLSSIFNSASTLFTMDLYTRMRKSAKDAELLIVGKVFVIIMVLVSTLWIPIITAYPGAELFNYIQSTTSYLAPPICAVFLLAVFWPRCNEPGAFWALAFGIVIGMARFILEVSFTVPACGSDDDEPPDWWYTIIGDVHYLHFGLFLWALCLVVAVVISLLTRPIPKDCLYRLTYWSRKSTKVRKDIDETLLGLQQGGNKRKEEGQEENGGGGGDGRGRADGNTSGGGGEFDEPRLRHPRHSFASIGGGGGGGGSIFGSRVRMSTSFARMSRRMQEDLEARVKAKKAAEFLYEDPAWKRFANINAAIIITITFFIYGFYY